MCASDVLRATPARRHASWHFRLSESMLAVKIQQLPAIREREERSVPGLRRAAVQCTRLENAPVVLNFKTLWFVGKKKLSEDVRYGVGKVSTIVDNIYRFFTR